MRATSGRWHETICGGADPGLAPGTSPGALRAGVLPAAVSDSRGQGGPVGAALRGLSSTARRMRSSGTSACVLVSL